MRTGFSNRLLGLLFLAVHLGAVSCREAVLEAGGSINNGNGDDPPVGEVDDVAGFYVRVYQGEDIQYYMHQAGSDFDKECVVKTDETNVANKDITCIVDIPEEDLRFHGVKLQYNVPTTMCDYAWFMPYYFENYQIAVGPVLLEYDKDQFGNFGLDNNDNGTIETGEEVPNYTISGLNEDTPKCQYDYSDSGGPNCCLGNYVITGRDWDTDTNQYFSRETVFGDWGGDPGSCLYGPAIETQTLTSDGWPMADIFYVKGEGLNDVYEPSAPLAKQAGTIYLANYFDPADHTTTDFPGYPGGLNTTSRYYELRCLDRAHELKSRIRVQIREWNEYSEWEKGASGDPDTTGTEVNFPDFGLNDFIDWADLVYSSLEHFPMIDRN
jgi:hypothetical protein